MSLSTELRIDAGRLKADFEALAAIGGTPEGGVHRPALEEHHIAARRWFRERALESRLDVSVDQAGNHSAVLRCPQPAAKTLLLGSHLDSVPYGGRFDGALGVLAALEVLRTVRDARLSLPVHLEAIDFTDEEGTNIGLLGSRALAGALTQEELASPRGGRRDWLEKLRRSGLSDAGILEARREPARLTAYLELHIEQGTALETAAADIGVVSSIAGIASMRISYHGRADHAGTTGMDERLDASQGAAAFITQAHALVSGSFPGCVFNVGRMSLEPGAFNIVPAEATLWVEFRAPASDILQRMRLALDRLGAGIAEELGLSYRSEALDLQRPVDCDAGVQRAFRGACETLGLRFITMVSRAGHDAMVLAGICPAGMIFVPSTGGSHSWRESADWADCVNGANALLQAALRLAHPAQLD